MDVLIYFYSRDVLKLPHCIYIFSSFISICLAHSKEGTDV